MKLKKFKIIIKPTSTLKDELLSALRGKTKKIQDPSEITLNSVEAYSQIFTKSRIEILLYLTSNSPTSIYDLAKSLKRNFKNVHTDINLLSDLGLIKLEKSNSNRGSLIPKAKYSGIELSFVA